MLKFFLFFTDFFFFSVALKQNRDKWGVRFPSARACPSPTAFRSLMQIQRSRVRY